MLVRCISNKGVDILDRFREWETDETVFSTLKIGDEYTVYAIEFLSKRNEFLLCPDGSKPTWAPQQLFEVVDNSIPNNWQIRLLGESELYDEIFKQTNSKGFVGYERLINYCEHYTGIIERDENELIYFFKNIKHYPVET